MRCRDPQCSASHSWQAAGEARAAGRAGRPGCRGSSLSTPPGCGQVPRPREAGNRAAWQPRRPARTSTTRSFSRRKQHCARSAAACASSASCAPWAGAGVPGTRGGRRGGRTPPAARCVRPCHLSMGVADPFAAPAYILQAPCHAYTASLLARTGSITHLATTQLVSLDDVDKQAPGARQQPRCLLCLRRCPAPRLCLWHAAGEGG